jgi:hypothetical protein
MAPVSSFHNRTIEALSRKPAYVLVFGIAVLIFVPSAVTIREDDTLVMLVLALFALSGVSIVLVEWRQAVPVTGTDERRGLALLKDERAAARTLLGPIADDNADLTFVYSSTPVSGFMDHQGRTIDRNFTEEEKLVTTVPDTSGIGAVHTLLHLAGRNRERLLTKTTRDFRPTDWDRNLILIGSQNSNPHSQEALTNFRSPLRFTEDATSIVAVGSANQQWPLEGDVNDYAVIVKRHLTPRAGDERAYLVVAGIGPIGTQAACHYLLRHVVELAGEFRDSEFACLLAIDPELGFTQAKRVPF